MFVIEMRSRKHSMVVENCAVCRLIIVGLQMISVNIYWGSYCSHKIHSSFYMSLEMMTPAETGNNVDVGKDSFAINFLDDS